MTACIGEPVSWLRLERLALGELPASTAAEVRAHLAACPACAAALARITDDARPLPRLVMAPPRPWWRRRPAWVFGGVGLSLVGAAAAIALAIQPTSSPRSDAIRVKGAGLVEVALVRERAGVVAFDPSEVAPDDRWKVEVTCAAGAAVWIDVAVIQGARVEFPLPPAQVACANHAPVPGAFRITDGGAEVCVAVAAEPPERDARGADPRRGARCRVLRAADAP